jgi:hypothetical protein
MGACFTQWATLMEALVLYCKSYSKDVFRVKRLAVSVERHNQERLPFYVSVPAAELPLFAEQLAGLKVHLISDESILSANPLHLLAEMAALPGGISQQIVKSEFWRLNLCENYLCLDSDAVFIRDFGRDDFLTADGVPYTTVEEVKDLFEGALAQRKTGILENFQREAKAVQNTFERPGRAYSFGPMPLVWSRLVWLSLEKHFLQPRALSFAAAIERHPMESRWYGEALLKYRAIPLYPCQSLFKVYHYSWQLAADRRRGLNQALLSKLYLGVIYQSAWEKELDWPKEPGSWLSRLARRFKRIIGR